MPIDTSGLSRAFKKLGEQFEYKDPVYRAEIISDDGDNSWTVDFLNPDGTKGARRAVKGTGYYWPGLIVRISRDRKVWGPDYWVIMAGDVSGYGTGAPEPTLPLHGWMHGFYQPDETTNLATFQIYSLRVQPADPTDLTVDVMPGIYYAGEAFHYLDAVSNENLAAYVAALGLGERQYLVLSIDSAGAINVTEGAPKVGALDAEDIPDPPIAERGLCAVDVRNGDTTLERERMYADLRWLAGGVPVDMDTRYVNITGDTMTGALMVDGSVDAIQLVIQGAIGQSVNLQEWQDNNGIVLLAVQEDGDLLTDRWLGSVTNTFLGIETGGAGNLAHGGANEGWDNTALGYNTLNAITTGYWNVALGPNAGASITTGYANVLMGNDVGNSITVGQSNFGCGNLCLNSLTTGNANTCLGNVAGAALTTASNNTFIGNGAGRNTTVADYNTCIGYFAGRTGDLLTYNVMVGAFAGQNNIGQYNVLLGGFAGDSTTSASSNVYIGLGTARAATTGDLNVVIGQEAGRNMSSGAHNVYLGHNAGFNAAGTASVLIGYQAGYNEANSNRLYIANSNTVTPLIYGEFDGAGGVGVKIHSPVATAVVLTAKGFAAQTANLFELQESDGSIFVASGDGLGGSIFSGNQQLEDIDFVWAGDTEANLFRVDAGADVVRLGDWDTNYAEFANDGDLTFVGTAGLPFGSCYGNEIAWTQAAAVQNTWYDISDADMVTGQLNNVTHDGNGQLTVLKAGMFMADWSGAFEADSANVHVQLTFSINGAETNAGINHFETFATNRQSTAAGNAILDLAANDTVNVSIRTTDAGAPDLSVDHLMLRLVQVGGT